ncbi:MAG: DnaA regulatory inactivator Hda [Gammaproteobacteria bacterium]|nr:DnaA regulatory inactivator Hda [Gammaproteobacteria bacterium]
MTGYQIPLQIRLNDAATFDNYFAGANRDIVRILQAQSEPYVYLWSASATGKTHLLQACCHAQPRGQAIYLPLLELASHPAEMLDGLEQFSLVCLDDVQAVVGKAEWELGLFNLYNRLREQGGHLWITATVSPEQLSVQLPDLASRLKWGPVFQLQTLTDEDKVKAMQGRARQRGFQLPDDVANYLLNRFSRDMHHLFALLDKLDTASLQAQRRLTIPFVKELL